LTRIYEALKHASQQHQTPHSPAVTLETDQKTVMPATLIRSIPEMDAEMLTLYQAVESLLADIPRKLVMFMGSSPGEGTSTLARGFATLAAEHMNKRVLLFDADRLAPNQKNFFGIPNQAGWQDSIEADSVKNVICQIGTSHLFLCPSSNNVSISPEIFDTRTITATMKKLREMFDLVVIDAPPPIQSPDGLALAAHVDGAILVVEAENTRWKVTENTKNRLISCNAKILGMAFNKRRYYIPDVIYRHLS
jgi:protein-tyrosine kinase